jgi:Spy/CpxP family protein refolding chaperone
MTKKVFAIALATLLVIGAISIAFSQGRGRRGRDIDAELGRSPGIIEQVQTELNLTAEQKEKLQSLRIDIAKEVLPLRNEMQIKALELRQLWMADELDDEAILAKSQEISALRDQMQEKMVHHRLDAAKVLTKEQRDKLSLTGRRWGRAFGLAGFGCDGQRGFGRSGRFGMGKGPRWNR